MSDGTVMATGSALAAADMGAANFTGSASGKERVWWVGLGLGVVAALA
jgi:hypothetical protein